MACSLTHALPARELCQKLSSKLQNESMIRCGNYVCLDIYFFFSVLPFSKYSLGSLSSNFSTDSCKNDGFILTNSISTTDDHSLASCKRVKNSYEVWRD